LTRRSSLNADSAEFHPANVTASGISASADVCTSVTKVLLMPMSTVTYYIQLGNSNTVVVGSVHNSEASSHLNAAPAHSAHNPFH